MRLFDNLPTTDQLKPVSTAYIPLCPPSCPWLGVAATVGRSLTDIPPLFKHPPVVPGSGRPQHHPTAGDIGRRPGRPCGEVRRLVRGRPLVPVGVADVSEIDPGR